MNMSAMDMSPEWPAALLAWPVILAQTLILGSALFSVMLNLHSSNQSRGGYSSARALAGWWRMLTLVIAAFSPLIFLKEAAGMAGVSMGNAWPLLREVLTQTHAGHIWMWRLPAAFALALAAWLPLRESARAPVLVFLDAVFCIAGSLQSHAIDFGATAVALRFVHALAAGAWSGSLFGYWVNTRSADQQTLFDVHAAHLLSRLAGWSVSILIISGAYVAFEGLGRNLGHLLYSSYGRVLSVKVEVFALVLIIGAYNRFYVVPILDSPSAQQVLKRNVALESLMIVGIVGMAALLAATPPARMSMMGSANESSIAMPLRVSLSKK